MSHEETGRKQRIPKSQSSSLSQQGLEEEEVGLASNRTVPTSRNYAIEMAGEQSDQRRYRFMLHLVAVIFISSLLFFSYRKFYLPSHNSTSLKIRQNIQSPPEEEIEIVQARPPVEMLQLQPNIWYYPDNSENYHELRVLYQANNRRYAKASNFSFISINKLIIHKYLSDPAKQIIATVDTALSKHKNRVSLLRMLTLLFILQQHGGIAISDNLLMTEDLTWLKNIRTNIFLNGDFTDKKVDVVGFYTPEQSPDPIQVDWSTNRWRQDVAFPALQKYFLAAKKNSDFLEQLIKRLSQTLISSQALAQSEKRLPQHATISLEDYLFQTTANTVMTKKGVNAVILYGVAVLNEHYGPTKMEIQMRNATFDQRMTLLSHLELGELEDNFGKFRYFTLLKHEDDMIQYLNSNKMNSKALMDGSFMRTYLLTEPKLQFAYVNPQREAATLDVWTKLPKIVWVYTSKGIENNDVVTSLLVARIQTASKEISFEFREVNDSNIHLYLDNRTIERLDIAQTRLDGTNHNVKSELIRLALIYYHGGVFLDLSIVLVQSLDWLPEIASITSGRIYDRCGSLPKVLLLWDPFATHPLFWKVNEDCNTKQAPHLAYLDYFIAAEPHSQLIKQWLDIQISLLSTPNDEIQDIFQQCGIDGSHISDTRSMQKLGLDALQCALGNRQKQMQLEVDRVQASASQSYQLWSMSSLIGLYKATPANLLEREVIYQLTQFPTDYLDQARGYVHYFLRLSDEQVEELNDYIIQHHDNLIDNLHPESFVAKYVLGSTQFKVIYEDGAMRVKV